MRGAGVCRGGPARARRRGHAHARGPRPRRDHQPPAAGALRREPGGRTQGDRRRRKARTREQRCAHRARHRGLQSDQRPVDRDARNGGRARCHPRRDRQLRDPVPGQRRRLFRAEAPGLRRDPAVRGSDFHLPVRAGRERPLLPLSIPRTAAPRAGAAVLVDELSGLT